MGSGTIGSACQHGHCVECQNWSTTYHTQDKLVVESQEQREEEVGTKPGELDGTGDRVLVLKVVVLGRLRATSVALDIEFALNITISLLGEKKRERLLVVGMGRHGDGGCAGFRGDAIAGGLSYESYRGYYRGVSGLIQSRFNDNESTIKSTSAVDCRRDADEGTTESSSSSKVDVVAKWKLNTDMEAKNILGLTKRSRGRRDVISMD
jgi:hypothetical protein